MNANLFIAKTLWSGLSGDKGFSGSSSGIAGASIAISLIVMILSVSISDGFKREIRAKASGFSGELILHSPGEDVTTTLYPVNSNSDFVAKIEHLKGVEAVFPFAYRSGIVKHGEEIQGVMVKGVGEEFDWHFFRSALVEGSIPVLGDTSATAGIIISARLAKMLGYAVGDRVLLYFIDNSVRARNFILTGIYSAQLEDIDKTLVVTDIKIVQQLNGWKEYEASGLEVRVSERADIETLAEEIEATIMDSEDDAMFVTKIDELFPHLFDWLKLLDFNVLFILVLMLAVAGFNMVSGLLILTFEKISMIGLLKALGMRNSDVHKIFMLRALKIVFTGLVVGNLTGIMLASLQSRFGVVGLDPANYFVDTVPIYMDWLKITLLNICTVLVITLVLYIPSAFISNVSPEKSLRFK